MNLAGATLLMAQDLPNKYGYTHGYDGALLRIYIEKARRHIIREVISKAASLLKEAAIALQHEAKGPATRKQANELARLKMLRDQLLSIKLSYLSRTAAP